MQHKFLYAALTFAQKCGQISCSGTVELILFFDKLFDSLNGVRQSSKPLARPLTDKSEHDEFWASAKLFLNKLEFTRNGSVVEPPPSIKNFIKKYSVVI